MSSSSSFSQTYFGSGESKLRSGIFIVLALLLAIFIIYDVVRIVAANQTPLFGYVYEEGQNPTALFPQIGICPGRNLTTQGTLTKVTCNVVDEGGIDYPLEVTSSTYTIDTIIYTCFDINQNLNAIAANLTDLIRCAAWSDMNVILTFYDSGAPVPTYWFGWTVIPWGQDSAIGIVKWFYRGQEVGYQVQTIQQEYRFNSEPNDYGVLFTVQYDFLGEGLYGEIIAFDFWTELGVVGGYVFLASQLFRFLYWCGFYVFKLDRNPEARPLPRDYGAL